MFWKLNKVPYHCSVKPIQHNTMFSFPNDLMGGGTPSTEKGCTEVMWSDRHAWFINSVSEDGKTIEIERPKVVRTDSNDMSECQTYDFQRRDNPIKYTLRFAYKGWWVLNSEGKRHRKMRLDFHGMSEYFDYSF